MNVSARELTLLHDAVVAQIRGANQVYTSGRRQLVELLAGLRRPVTIPELLAAHPKLTQSSVYRNLSLLEQVGAVQKVASSDDRARYELAEQLIGHHHHLICNSCGRVDDFVVPESTEHALDDVLAAAVAATGFRPSGHRLDIVGTCAGCP